MRCLVCKKTQKNVSGKTELTQICRACRTGIDNKRSGRFVKKLHLSELLDSARATKHKHMEGDSLL